MNYIKLSKSIELVDQMPESVSSEEWSGMMEAWSGLFKLPQLVAKFTGKLDNAWTRSIFPLLYRYVVRDFESLFEEERSVELHLPHFSPPPFKPKNVVLVGVEKSREIRQSIHKMRSMYKSVNVDQQFSLGECALPFFCCIEMGDRGSEYQATNELAMVMKAALECQLKFFQSKSAPKKRIVVVGVVSVGHMITGYIMRKRHTSEDKSASVFVMQPLDSFNLGIYDDLLRLAKFLSSVRLFGEDVVNESKIRFKSLASSSQKSEGKEKDIGKQPQTKPSVPQQEDKKHSPSTGQKRKVPDQREDKNQKNASKKPKRESPTQKPAKVTQDDQADSDLDAASDDENKE